ncbi:MAG: hypothetical protein CVU57_13545 [Deltaproteobacteria bacterium HGW-Deltaproteobacteria-15]|jgi:glycosyltransferase involved in cell wall biosynthesis|nr:MAG: hypothetical protein CVU57_13545 [Deltaproteobacteria bacterium HGW-Deltaproteobacteria-15]
MRYLADNYPNLEIDVFASNKGYRNSAKHAVFKNWDGIQVHRIDTPRSNQSSTLMRFLMGTWFSLRTALELAGRNTYDFVFLGTNPPSAPLIAKLTPWMRRVPYAYLIHDLYPDVLMRLGILPQRHPFFRIAKHFQRQWLKDAKKVIVIGRCMRDHIIDNYDLLPEQIAVITNWSDPKAIPLLPKCTRFREKHSLSGFLVLYAGNFGKYQNFESILDAAELLQEREEEITFVFVGEGAKKDYLIRTTAKKRLNNVQFFPFVPTIDYPDLLASADVSLVTLESNMEGVGVPSKFYNILASGRPTLAILNPSSEVARVLNEYDCGIRVDPESPNQIADALNKLLYSPSTVLRMGHNARQAFLKNYTLEIIAEQYIRTFREVARKVKEPVICTM